MKKFIIIILLWLLIPSLAVGLDVYVESLLLNDVQTAVNSVEAAGGGTVYLPAGSVIWTSYLLVPGGVNLIGYGSPVWNDQNSYQTTIRWNYNGGAGIVYNYRFGVNHYDRSFRMANLNLIGSSGASDLLQNILRIDFGKNFRIDHCYFDRGNYMVAVNSATGKPSTGLFDHCKWSMAAWGITAGYCLSIGDRAEFDEALPKVFGTSDAVFVEDSYMEDCGAHTVGSFGGTKWVFRYNIVANEIGHQPVLDAHGPGFTGDRGAWGYEVYGNTFNSPLSSPLVWCEARMRSGDGVFWGNTINNTRHFVNVTLDPGSCGTPLCKDAPGHKGDGTSSGEAIYIWGNTLNNVTEGEILIETVDCTDNCVQLGVQVISNPKSGYTSYVYPHPLQGGGGKSISFGGGSQSISIGGGFQTLSW